MTTFLFFAIYSHLKVKDNFCILKNKFSSMKKKFLKYGDTTISRKNVLKYGDTTISRKNY